MRLDGPRQNLELNVPVAVDGDGPSDPRVGIRVADDHMPTDGGIHIAANIGGANPQSTVIPHVHEVDSDVVGASHASLPFARSPRFDSTRA